VFTFSLSSVTTPPPPAKFQSYRYSELHVLSVGG
jgi:hypothetical protein